LPTREHTVAVLVCRDFRHPDRTRYCRFEGTVANGWRIMAPLEQRAFAFNGDFAAAGFTELRA